MKSNNENTMEEQKLAVFKGQNIRRILHNDEWWFSVVDICLILTESKDPGAYWRKLKQRLTKEESQVVTNCHALKLTSSDGKKYATDCANTEGIFRILQSIPSPKAEPFKRWLAKVGYERVQEIEDPELATKRTRALYKAKGYPDSWIEKRMRGIEIRETLTDEWTNRGIKDQKDYAILTSEIHEATFGVKPSEHKDIKGLEKENLRDHMNDLELIFSMLGEASTTDIAKTDNAQGFEENLSASKRGGNVAKVAREQHEKETGKKVLSQDNFLHLKEGQEKRKLNKD